METCAENSCTHQGWLKVGGVHCCSAHANEAAAAARAITGNASNIHKIETQQDLQLLLNTYRELIAL